LRRDEAFFTLRPSRCKTLDELPKSKLLSGTMQALNRGNAERLFPDLNPDPHRFKHRSCWTGSEAPSAFGTIVPEPKKHISVGSGGS